MSAGVQMLPGPAGNPRLTKALGHTKLDLLRTAFIINTQEFVFKCKVLSESVAADYRMSEAIKID